VSSCDAIKQNRYNVNMGEPGSSIQGEAPPGGIDGYRAHRPGARAADPHPVRSGQAARVLPGRLHRRGVWRNRVSPYHARRRVREGYAPRKNLFSSRGQR